MAEVINGPLPSKEEARNSKQRLLAVWIIVTLPVLIKPANCEESDSEGSDFEVQHEEESESEEGVPKDPLMKDQWWDHCLRKTMMARRSLQAARMSGLIIQRSSNLALPLLSLAFWKTQFIALSLTHQGAPCHFCYCFTLMLLFHVNW